MDFIELYLDLNVWVKELTVVSECLALNADTPVAKA